MGLMAKAEGCTKNKLEGEKRRGINGKRRETYSEAISTPLAKDEDSDDQGNNKADGGTWSVSLCILNMELTEYLTDWISGVKETEESQSGLRFGLGQLQGELACIERKMALSEASGREERGREEMALTI